MERKIKIALVVSHPIQHFCPQYVSFSKNNGVDFKVFFASMLGFKKYVDKNFNQEISWSNLNLDKFNHVFLNGEAVLQSGKNLDAASLDDALAGFSPDAVIIYGYFQKFQRRAHRWAVKNSIPLAYISDSEHRHSRNKVKEFFKYFFIRKYFSKINYFLSVGDANEAFYKYYGVRKESIIRMHFPIDVLQYEVSYNERTQLRKKMRQDHGIDEASIVLSVVGKLAPWKNQDHIIDAMKKLEARGICLHLFILGSGQMMEAWQIKAKELSKSKVHFPGFVNINELPAYYANTDIYVHPASVEPHSIAISEAIYMGCPVIISDRCGSYGINDDVQEKRNGYVYSYGDIEQLAAAIEMLSENEQLKNSYGQYSHQIAVQFQNIAHRHTLQELVNKIVLKNKNKTGYELGGV